MQVTTRYFYPLIIMTLLVAFALRIYALEADAPYDVSPSQELVLDGPATILGARNMALFGEWEPVESPLKPERYWPGMSRLGLGFFTLIGVGFWQANFISVVTGMLSIAFAAGFAREHFGKPAALFTTFFIALNFIYIVYNRDPMAYTTATAGMMMALYLWGRGLKRPFWLFLSGVATAFFALFFKLPAIAMLPAAFIGFIPLIRGPSIQTIPWTPRLRGPVLFTVGFGLGIAGWLLLIYLPDIQTVSDAYYARTFSPAYGFEENIRFALVSLLQFGVGFGFMVRMLPLFLLAFSYLLFRLFKLVTRHGPPWTPAEAVAFGLLGSVTVMLLASAIRPLRFQIVLIPPMAVIAGLACQHVLQRKVMSVPGRLGRLTLILLNFSLAYLLYQFLAALLLIWRMNRNQAGPISENVNISIATSFLLLAIAFLLSIVLTLLYLRFTMEADTLQVKLPNYSRRASILFGILCLTLVSALIQYGSLATRPTYTIVNTSREVGEIYPTDSTILGGSYSPVLVLENELPAVWFYGNSPADTVLASPFTHMALEVESPLETEVTNYARLVENIPPLTETAILSGVYDLRGYVVHIYQRTEEKN